MNDYTTTPPTKPGYYIYINRHTFEVEIINLGWKIPDWNDKYPALVPKNYKLYNFNAHENNWGPDRGWLWNNEGLWKKIDMPSDPERLIQEFYGQQQQEIH